MDLRISIQQPSLPKYRAPLYQRLARMTGACLVLYYGSEEPGLKNVEPVGFHGRFEDFRRWQLPVIGDLFWHAAQWRIAGSGVSDVAILCWNARYLSLFPALLRARWNGIPVALWGHGFSKSESRVRSFFRMIPAKMAQAIVLYDFRTAEEWARSGFPRQKIFVAPNGLSTADIGSIRAEVMSDERARRAFRLTNGLDGRPVLIYIGRIYSQNRLDLAIKALAPLSRIHPQVQLIVIGGGNQVEKLQELARRVGVEARVRWLGPIYSEPEVARWMIEADVLVYPCNVGLSLIHAFNYGLPAVVCAPLTAHNPEVWALDDGVNGKVADRADADAIAEAIEFIVSVPGRHSGMRSAAVECCEKTYNIDAVGRTFERLIQFLGGQRGKSQ